jgi:Zn-finger nucleic acid-binding protein
MIDFEVWCNDCGTGLCAATTVVIRSGGVHIMIDSCPKCCGAAHDEGRDEGYEDGYDEGKSDGYAEAEAEADE